MEPTKNYKKIAIKITEVASNGDRETYGEGSQLISPQQEKAKADSEMAC